MHRSLFLTATLVFTTPLHASEAAPFPFSEPQPWSEVERIEAAAAKARLPGYHSPAGRIVLAPDGSMATVIERGDPAMAMATLGRYTREGSWIQFTLTGVAMDLSRLDAEARAEYEAWQAQAEQIEADAALAEEVDATADAEPDPTMSAEIAAEMHEVMNPRLLVIPYRGGEVLLRESLLTSTAANWRGEGPLTFWPEAWRVPGMEPAKGSGFDMPEFSIDDPLHANLPWELSRLLRRDAIEARVSEAQTDAATLEWNQHRARQRLRLDRGERDGLYAGMDVYGLPPDEGVFAQIVEVQPDHAYAERAVERFAPGDTVELVGVGARVSTRRDATQGCGIDTSVAVRAKVIGAGAADALEFDADGYAWLPLEIDQGSAHGLALNDSFDAESHELQGEGRVRALQPDRATVLWRVQRWDEDTQPALPAVGAALVTPAWRRAEWDTFGNPSIVE